MPETARNTTSVAVSRRDGRQTAQSSFDKKSVLPVIFMGMSASVVTAEILDWIRVIGGNLHIVKIVLIVLAGFGGGFAAGHSNLVANRKRK